MLGVIISDVMQSYIYHLKKYRLFQVCAITMKLLSSLLSVGIFLSSASAEQYPELFHWAKSVEENSAAVLYCNEPNLNINTTGTTGYVKWYTPSGSQIMSPDNNYKLENVGNYNDMKLTVYKVNKTNNGIYKCTLLTSNLAITLIRGANVRGPKYTRFLDEYEYNVIVAVVATVVFLVPLLGSCGVWKFRYREDEDEKANMFNMTHEDNGTGPVMTEIPAKTVASTVESPEGNGAYENMATDTKL